VQQNEYQQVCWNSEESMFQRLAPARKQSNKNSLSDSGVVTAFAGKCFSLMNPVSRNPLQSNTPVLAKKQLARFRV